MLTGTYIEDHAAIDAAFFIVLTKQVCEWEDNFKFISMNKLGF